MADAPKKPSRRKPRRDEVKTHVGELKKRISLFELIEQMPPVRRPIERQLKLGFGR